MMRQSQVWAAVVCLLLAGGDLVIGETRKAGLWEISSTTSWQKGPLVPGSGQDPSAQHTRTRQLCLTQEMIDKYGALLPQSRGDCKIEDKVLRSGGSTAKYICSGTMRGQGTLDKECPALQHAKGTLHFTGTMLSDAGTAEIEWTTVSTSTFKSADCGEIKPLALPNDSR